MKKWLKRIFMGLTLLLILIIIGITWLGGTQSGLKWSLTQLQQILPNLQLKGTGTFFKQADFSAIEYKDAQINLSLKKFSFSWDPMHLISGTLTIKALHTEQLSITLLANDTVEEMPTENKTQSKISLPIKIKLVDMVMNDTRLKLNTGQQYVIKQLKLGAVVKKERVWLERFYLKIDQQTEIPLDMVANLSGWSDLNAPYKMQLNNDLLLKEAVYRLTIVGKSEGDIHQLDSQQTLKLPHEINIKGSLSELLSDVRWQTKITAPQLSWPLQLQKNTGINVSQLIINAKGSLTKFSTHITGKVFAGKIDMKGQYSVETQQGKINILGQHLQATPWVPEWPNSLFMDAQMIAKIEGARLLLQKLDLRSTENHHLTARAEIDIKQQAIKQMQINWQNISWPLGSIEKQFNSEGKLTLQGSADDFKATLACQTSGKALPDTQWDGIFKGDQKQLQHFNLKAKLLAGELLMQGSAKWDPNVDWQLQMSAKDLNPGESWPQWPGNIAFDISSTGRQQQELQADLNIKAITGVLRNYPINIKGGISALGEQYNINDLNIRSGKNSLTLSAQYKKLVNLQWQLEAPDLAAVLPDLSGSLKGHGQLMGDPELPHIKATLSGNKIAYQDIQLKQLTIAIESALQEESLDITLQLNELKQQQTLLLKSLQIEGRGQFSEHQIDLKLQTLNEKLSLKLLGGYDKKDRQWLGTMNAMVLQQKQWGTWRQQDSADIAISEQEVLFEHYCLIEKKSQATACVDVELMPPQQGKVSLLINNFDIPYFLKSEFPKDMRMSGSLLNAEIDIALAESGMLNGQGQVIILPGKITTRVEGIRRQFKYQGGNINFSIDERGLIADSSFRLPEKSGFSGQLQMPAMNRFPFAEAQPITAKFDALFPKMGIISRLVPQLKNPKGEVRIALRVGKTLSEPDIKGKIELLNSAIDIPDIGIKLKKIGFLIDAQNKENIKITGQMQSNQGQLNIDGNAVVQTADLWTMAMHITGEQFVVADIPYGNAQIEPNIKIQMVPGNVYFQGNLHLPYARITPQGVDPNSESTTVNNDDIYSHFELHTESSDVVTLNVKNKQPIEKALPWNTVGAINITLGDIKVEKVGLASALNIPKIKVDEFSTRLEGELKVAFNASRSFPDVYGDILFVEGVYKAFGTKLLVKNKSRIVFAGDVTNPALNIIARRELDADKNNDNVSEVGLKITGFANALQPKFYSYPELDNAAIISYLTTGRNLLSSLNQETGKKKKQMRLPVIPGFNISPKLNVGFGFDIFDESKSFNAEYDINKKMSIEGVAGDRDSGIDFIYKLGK